MLCDSSNLHKQKLVKPKPLASKMAAVKKVGQKNGEVGLLVEYLLCDCMKNIERFASSHAYAIGYAIECAIMNSMENLRFDKSWIVKRLDRKLVVTWCFQPFDWLNYFYSVCKMVET